ncbi:MAG: hypothetical protein CMC97_07120 [Flavobacteriales bacterium]|nr:hypothetical protein [Flavobacteriales bacterium]
MRAAPLSGLGLMTLTLSLVHCAGGGQAPTSDPRLAPAQPNLSSELAISMRDLDAELVSVRERLIAGEDISDARFTEHKFLDLAPTDSSMLIEGFQALTMAFERHVAEFNTAPDAAKYEAVVGGCEACHMRSCPGPLERIAKRTLPVDL